MKISPIPTWYRGAKDDVYKGVVVVAEVWKRIAMKSHPTLIPTTSL